MNRAVQNYCGLQTFLGDFKEHLDKTNHDFRYDPCEAIGTYFEYVKVL